MRGIPPSLIFQDSSALPLLSLLGTPLRPVIVGGVAATAVLASDAFDGALSPFAFMAMSSKLYAEPGFASLTVQDVGFGPVLASALAHEPVRLASTT